MQNQMDQNVKTYCLVAGENVAGGIKTSKNSIMIIPQFVETRIGQNRCSTTIVWSMIRC